MKPPQFWYKPRDLFDWRATLLAPLGWLSAWATAKRVARPPAETCPIPVICVGNINLGGTGKTPVVIALAQYLTELGLKPGVISRGYGGSLTGPVKVDPLLHTADQTGDEPMLIASFAPVWVSRDRAAAARSASNAGVDVILMDDGHQNPDVKKDLSIVVVDGPRGFGNGKCFPAGPLREPPAKGLARADAIISVGPTGAGLLSDLNAMFKKPVMPAHLAPLPTGMEWEGSRVLAFAGIGNPDKFFNTVRDLGADLCATVALDDHQKISPALWARIVADAERLNAQLVTTEKDAVRLTAKQKEAVLALPVRLQVEEPAQLDRVLKTIVQRAINHSQHH